MANYRQIARRDAQRYGLDPNVFERQINQESTFDPNAVSKAGAIGIAQIMPATAKGWGVNPRDPIASLDAAARNMASYVKKYGGIRNALIAYNAGPGAVGGNLPAETQGYLRTILGSGGGGSRSSGSPAPAAPPDASSPGQPASVDPGQSGDAAALLAALAQQQRPQIPSGGLAPPAFTAGPKLPSGFQAPPASSGGPAPAPNVSSLLALAATPGLSGQAPPAPGGAADPAASGASAGTPAAPAGTGKVIVAPGANRAGAGLSKPILNFVGQVAGIYGKPLTIGTGTNHSKMTTSGNVSDHWGGNGADIPASGKTLTRLGQDALIAAGMPAAQARKQTGGLFNVGDYQIIFNSNIGGNHYNHLHTGYRAGRG